MSDHFQTIFAAIIAYSTTHMLVSLTKKSNARPEAYVVMMASPPCECCCCCCWWECLLRLVVAFITEAFFSEIVGGCSTRFNLIKLVLSNPLRIDHWVSLPSAPIEMSTSDLSSPIDRSFSTQSTCQTGPECFWDASLLMSKNIFHLCNKQSSHLFRCMQHGCQLIIANMWCNLYLYLCTYIIRGTRAIRYMITVLLHTDLLSKAESGTVLLTL